MADGLTKLAGAVALTLLCVTAPAAAQQPPGGVPGSRVADPGAEAEGSPAAAWAGAGWAAATYGESPAVPPPGFAADRNYGARLFVAGGAGAALDQRVDLRDLSGGRLSVGGAFGGRAGADATARLRVELLDGAGAPVGAPVVVGGPSDADRGGSTTLLACFGEIALTGSERSARFVVEATGEGALADALFLTAEGYGGARGDQPARAVAQGCVAPDEQPGPSAPPAPPPTTPPPGATTPLARIVTHADPRRCRRGAPLRFGVRPSWRSEVDRVAVTARGRRQVRRPRRSIVVRAPSRTLTVRVEVVLLDGSRRSGVLRYRRCPADRGR